MVDGSFRWSSPRLGRQHGMDKTECDEQGGLKKNVV
jgi:hypothetical protein